MVNCVINSNNVFEPNFLPYFKNDTRNGNFGIPFNGSDQQVGGGLLF
jgi:hypothetical protein